MIGLEIPAGIFLFSLLSKGGENASDNSSQSDVHEDFGYTGGEMRLSNNGLETLQELEGFSATAYPDHKGYSIGYGHLIRPGDGLSQSSVIDRTKGAALLAQDVSSAENQVRKSITAPIDQNQFDALVIFCYNVGNGAFAGSTLVKKINRCDESAADEFDRWIYASGQVNDALVERRETEKNLFLS